MKFLLIAQFVVTFFIVFVSFVFAAPLDNSETATVLRYDNDIGIDGYKFGFETSDGIQREEEAELKNAGTDDEEIVIRGSYSYVGPDGETYKVNFIADRNGFQPTGEHLPHT